MATFAHTISVVDTQTAGERTRIVLSGLPPILGATMAEKKQFMVDDLSIIIANDYIALGVMDAAEELGIRTSGLVARWLPLWATSRLIIRRIEMKRIMACLGCALLFLGLVVISAPAQAVPKT